MSENIKTCPKCNTTVKDDEKFCHNCRNKFNTKGYK